MSVSLQLDKNNNLIFGDSFATVAGVDSLVQDIRTMLSMTRGEYPYNGALGLDYLSYLRSGDKQSLLAELTAAVLSDPRVTTCDFETSMSGKGLRVDLTTVMGQEVNIELE